MIRVTMFCDGCGETITPMSNFDSLGAKLVDLEEATDKARATVFTVTVEKGAWCTTNHPDVPDQVRDLYQRAKVHLCASCLEKCTVGSFKLVAPPV
jgi:hypothetical protein